MIKDFEKNIKIFKAIGEINRAKIIRILSTGEKCAGRLLEEFNFTQPTLSHHMKVLIDCNLVKYRKDKTVTYYSLNEETCCNVKRFFNYILTNNNINKNNF
ncbi:ArsR/SmtB family transcription factor [Clostridium isatidis]|uniref:ArsR/SmtB family transcription factor n=1 Tax=Clostridium isatidis TaxID=182773 RepID=UPI000E706888|nr:metalloregulator ArsR/SmtB family transcription factor [Clostridium isatidis]